MNRLQLVDVRADVAKNVNLGASDDRVPGYVNDACEGLLYKMKSVGTTPRYEICVNQNCITWPRQIETIEAAAICKRPATVRNGWFEFLNYGPGILIEGRNIGNQLVDAGEAGSFDNVTGTLKTLAVYCDVDEDAGAYITLQYYDKDGQWVRTEVGGEWIDGEQITFGASGTYVQTSLQVMPNGFVRAIKPLTNGTVRLYEYDTIALTYKPLAYFEPDETLPIYRRSLVPNLTTRGCCERTEDCGKISVTVIAKQRFIPALRDNDFVCIAYKRAIRLAAQAVFKEEAGKFQEALGCWAIALQALKEQQEHFEGHGAVQPINMTGAGAWGGGIPMLR
jgi:hypothetical protein